jgi:nucleoside-diphosphate-sugar epimerase
MNKILVTGASGWIGRHCVPLLASKGYAVHAVCRNRPPDPTHSNVSWHEVDLLAPGNGAEIILRVHPDCVLHLAWYAEPGKFWEAKENLDWVRATLELLRAFADNGGKRFVGAGSCAEYACNSGECVENSTPLIPNTLYGASKHAVESILRCFGLDIGFRSAWGRIFYLYGPHEHPSRLVAYVVRSLLSREPALCSEGTQILDFLHVEDAAAAFAALVESDVQGAVNIGSGRPIAVRDVLEEIGRQLDRRELIQFGARSSTSGPESLWANVQRLKSETAWLPHFTLATGIKQTIEWWKSRMDLPACPDARGAGDPLQTRRR